MAGVDPEGGMGGFGGAGGSGGLGGSGGIGGSSGAGGSGGDGGTSTENGSDGCGCVVNASPRDHVSGVALAALTLLGLALMRRRQRH